MNSNLLFDFTVDKANKTIHVRREFDADLALVWQAWTKAELLDQWWAPKPWRAETKQMDFKEGGKWVYAMVSPEGEKHWAMLEYKKIVPQKSFLGLDAFSDEAGNINVNFPRSNWKNEFSAEKGTTTVNVTITYDDLEQLEKIIEMGFKEGFTMGLQNLDELLVTLKK